MTYATSHPARLLHPVYWYVMATTFTSSLTFFLRLAGLFRVTMLFRKWARTLVYVISTTSRNT